MALIKGYLQLLRPPNLFTALADILAGVAVVYGFYGFYQLPVWLAHHQTAIMGLSLSSIFLYGGGVVLNDYFDASLDAVERPERPIPSGRVSALHALVLGLLLLGSGVVLAFTVTSLSGFLALLIAVLVLLYDALSKHSKLFGPLNMGLCRACNLLLGMSLLGSLELVEFSIAIIPLVYIAAITLISQGEVRGGNKGAVTIGLTLFVLVGIMVGSLGLLDQFELIFALPFIAIFLLMTLPASWTARADNAPKSVMRAVKMGVLALIPLNAALAAGFTGWIIGLLLLILLPLSLLTARLFAVT